MPIISQVGARSPKVQALYAAIIVVLIAGAASMVYPFLLMLAGSVKSEADLAYVSPWPRFWFDDQVLFQKYVESKYNVELDQAQEAWWEDIRGWSTIASRPAGGRDAALDEFLEWRTTMDPRWWFLGHTSGGRMLPINARLFRARMYDRFKGDIDAYRREIGIPVKSWNAVLPPMPSPVRFPREQTGLYQAYLEFAGPRPVEDRIILNPDALFTKTYLIPKYSSDVADYNRAHGTDYASYQDVFLTERAPEGGLARQEWEEYVREEIRLDCLRLTPSLAPAYQRFLADERYESIAEYNEKNDAHCASFADTPFSVSLPESRAAQIDWEAFLRSKPACPIEAVEIYGPRQSFEEFVARRRGVPVESIRPLRLPIAEADYHDAMAHKTDLRWEFTTRNYKQVFSYLFLHGRGFLNTLIYCALAITLALIVNPLAAYALSRYRPPNTYKILLFCIATMAFPQEVTMIPAFLLMRRFPLWPLLGGAGGFLLVFWLLNRARPFWPETLRLTLALGAGVVAAYGVAPRIVGAPTVSLLNTFAALTLPHMASGYSIFLLKGFFDSLPKDLYEAADIDGAGEWTKFWTISMSLSKPILAVIALQAFIQAYSQFMIALIIIPDQTMWTLMVWIFQLQTESHQAVVYASLVVAAIPTLVVFALCQNVIMRGIVVPVEK
ncbi:MAG: carbohydrate ABC transporter permease [Candidatus Sumerlaeota bacterium]|nr:carbohydrate ABC transporter permease [Candidatus Sumerlaeota bacterium]